MTTPTKNSAAIGRDPGADAQHQPACTTEHRHVRAPRAPCVPPLRRCPSRAQNAERSVTTAPPRKLPRSRRMTTAALPVAGDGPHDHRAEAGQRGRDIVELESDRLIDHAVTDANDKGVDEANDDHQRGKVRPHAPVDRGCDDGRQHERAHAQRPDLEGINVDHLPGGRREQGHHAPRTAGPAGSNARQPRHAAIAPRVPGRPAPLQWSRPPAPRPARWASR